MQEILKSLELDINPATAALSVAAGFFQLCLYWLYGKYRGPREHTPEGRKVLSRLKSTPSSEWTQHSRPSRICHTELHPFVQLYHEGEVEVQGVFVDNRFNSLDRRAVRQEYARILSEQSQTKKVASELQIDSVFETL